MIRHLILLYLFSETNVTFATVFSAELMISFVIFTAFVQIIGSC